MPHYLRIFPRTLLPKPHWAAIIFFGGTEAHLSLFGTFRQTLWMVPWKTCWVGGFVGISTALPRGPEQAAFPSHALNQCWKCISTWSRFHLQDFTYKHTECFPQYLLANVLAQWVQWHRITAHFLHIYCSFPTDPVEDFNDSCLPFSRTAAISSLPFFSLFFCSGCWHRGFWVWEGGKTSIPGSSLQSRIRSPVESISTNISLP